MTQNNKFWKQALLEQQHIEYVRINLEQWHHRWQLVIHGGRLERYNLHTWAPTPAVNNMLGRNLVIFLVRCSPPLLPKLQIFSHLQVVELMYRTLLNLYIVCFRSEKISLSPLKLLSRICVFLPSFGKVTGTSFQVGFIGGFRIG